MDSLTYDNVNHYYAPKFEMFLGKDKYYPGFSGHTAYVNVVLGEGAFVTKIDDNDNVFGLGIGLTKLRAGDGDDDIFNIDKTLDSSFDDSDPVFDEDSDRDDVENVVEYGYGFWLRFLTTYPKRLPNGKNAPWYFVSRLTTNIPYNDIEMGDRILAIW